MRAALIASFAAAAALLAGTAAPMAVGAAGPAFGQHVAGCARADLGARTAPPAVTCAMPDGSTMTFDNFGAMGRHMHEMWLVRGGRLCGVTRLIASCAAEGEGPRSHRRG